MYKKASQLKLRFSTTVGLLSVEQLWDLNLTQLSNAVKAVKKVLNKTDDTELSFLDDTQVIDVENQLRFDILKDVYLTKKKANEDARTALEAKQQKQRILEIIAKKEDESLETKSIEELKALL